MAGLYKNKIGSGDCLVLNTDGRVAEAISSNIFLVDNGKVFTPALTEACVAGVMRETIIEHLQSHRIPIIEKGIAIEDLLKADEIFLTDVIHGIRWVSAFRTKRYFNNFSRSLLSEINESFQIRKTTT
jgi:branched-chain amino acid aminotransferase